MASSPRTRLVVPLPVVCEPSPPGSGWPTGAGSQTTPNHRRTASKSALTENAPYKSIGTELQCQPSISLSAVGGGADVCRAHSIFRDDPETRLKGR